MLELTLSFVVASLLFVLAYFKAKTHRMLNVAKNIPGPTPLPFFGNVLDIGINNKYFSLNLNNLLRKYGTPARGVMGTMIIIILADPKHTEVILSSTKTLHKAFFYRFLHQWLGSGLLTSTGQKWKTHRKLITPTFHFKILEQFVEVFGRNGEILVERLSKNVGGPKFDIFPYITLYALDNISETAMGVEMHAQQESESNYVKAIRDMGDVAMLRTFKPWIYPDAIFKWFPEGRRQARSLKLLHDMTNSVIKSRRQLLLSTNKDSGEYEDDSGIKRRMAFLDLLLQSSENGETLTDEEIREEVDTFMFEGHDTTTSGICFSLYCIGKHQDVQEKVVQELVEIFGDSKRHATYQDLQNMKYLELVIKEALRLYPTVPFFGRELEVDVAAPDGYVFPSGSHILFVPYMQHRHPDHFPDPEKFEPERFLPENSVGRHPYAYIPFAAGPRNCIGQRFAMLELKSCVSDILRNYRIQSTDEIEEQDLFAELVLKSSKGVNLKFEKRDFP